MDGSSLLINQTSKNFENIKLYEICSPTRVNEVKDQEMKEFISKFEIPEYDLQMIDDSIINEESKNIYSNI